MIVASNHAPSPWRIVRLLLAVVLWAAAAGPAVAAQAAEPALTLEQAITQVQQQSGGKVLSASTIGTQRRGKNAFEHRIRVLTPNGHIRVVSIYSDAAKPPAPTEADSTKTPAVTGDGNKEKH
ncbi:hypothetical protein [Dyella sp.]|uniref:PepSY domain-containing protein n=1 Tax=Dyella sp. TaxID=1869338 RepID=UPI002ED07935